MRDPSYFWGRARSPVYQCRVCGRRFERVNDLASVLEHESAEHAQPTPVYRESSILGADGKHMVIEVGG